MSRRVLVTGCLPVIALTLAACGGATQQTQVASLPNHGTNAKSTSTNVDSSGGIPDPDGRPRDSLDNTNAQESALYSPYFACLRAHRYVDQATGPARLTVAAKCEKLEPLPPWQIDPTNPQARAFIGLTVSCLEAKGYHARADLVTNVQIQAPAWYVAYSPKNMIYKHSTTAAQNACQQTALK